MILERKRRVAPPVSNKEVIGEAATNQGREEVTRSVTVLLHYVELMSAVIPYRHSLLRLAAALLAWLGLLAMPLRTIAACPMIDGAAVASSAVAGASVEAGANARHGDHAEHNGHAGHGASPAGDNPSAPESPAHESCPDLAHCAVATLTPPLTLAATPTIPAAALRVTALTAPLSVERGLEPPPKA